MADQKLRICFVPMCPNTSKSTPHKVFLDIPQDPVLRDKWFRAVGRLNQGLSSNYFCCEDHFDLQDDLQKYYEVKGGKMGLSDDLVPNVHKKRDYLMGSWNQKQEVCTLRKKLSDSGHKDNNSAEIKQDIQDQPGPSSPVPSTSTYFGNLQIKPLNETATKVPKICDKVPRASAKNTSDHPNSRRHFRSSSNNLYRLQMLREKKRFKLEEQRINTLRALVLAISISNNTVVDAINGLRQDLVQIRDVLAHRFWAIRN